MSHVGVYKIGDRPITEEGVLDERFEAPNQLKVGDGAFVRSSDGDRNWRYAIVVVVNRTTVPWYIIFQVTLDGGLWQIKLTEWRDQVRPLAKKYCKSFHPKGEDLAHAAPFYAISMQDEEQWDQHFSIQSITGLPVYADMSFEELRLSDYLEGNNGLMKTNAQAEMSNSHATSRAKQRSPKPKLEVDHSDPLGSLWVGHALFYTPKNRKTYTKREALEYISRTAKYSDERGAMIKFMVDAGYIPCTRKCLYELIKRTEDKHLPIGDDEWSKRGHPTKSATALKKKCTDDNKIFSQHKDVKLRKQKVRVDSSLDFSERLQTSYFREKVWRGNIAMGSVCCVTFEDDLEKLFKKSVNTLASGKVVTIYMEFRKRKDFIDICKYIGRCMYGIGIEHQIYRIYFDPETYPPPKNVDNGGNSKSFLELRNEIRCESVYNGSAVICNGGQKERTFTCKHNSKMRRDKKDSSDLSSSETTRCPFGFTIRWDKYGYYIHLMSGKFSWFTNGCPFHSCDGK